MSIYPYFSVYIPKIVIISLFNDVISMFDDVILMLYCLQTINNMNLLNTFISMYIVS